MVDVLLLREKTVDIDATRAAAVQDRSREPRFTATFDCLLYALLN
jgi:hypothetical protein